MNALETIRSRRSIRKYKEGTEIPKEDLKQILEAALVMALAGAAFIRRKSVWKRYAKFLALTANRTT